MDSEPGLSSSFTPVDPPSGANTGLFIAIAIGLAGILLGGIALYLNFSGSDKAAEAETALKTTAERASTLESRLEAIEARIDKILSEQSAQDRQMKNLATQTQSALNQVGQEFNSLRQHVNTIGSQVKELTEKMVEARSAPAPAATAAASPGNTTGSGSAATTPSGHREHVITSGDTFARLANLYGVSVDQILAANPDADPRRLQLGQRIKIPHGSHSKED